MFRIIINHLDNVPNINTTTIVNKKSVYDEEVVWPTKNIEKNLVITNIRNVSVYELERCIRIILENNSNVIFYTVQYLEDNKQVNFYTNQAIETKVYKESSFANRSTYSLWEEAIKDLEIFLTYPENKDENSISLYDFAMVLENMKNNYYMMLESYRTKFEEKLKKVINYEGYILIYPFDCNIKTFKISSPNFDEIEFCKKNNELCLVNSNDINKKQIFNILKLELSKLYDEFLNIADFLDEKNKKTNIKSINSNFIVSASKNVIYIKIKNLNNQFGPSVLEMSSGVKDSNNYLINTEREIFKKIFVKIDDCPKWSKKQLYELRKEQLKEEEIKFNEIKQVDKNVKLLKKLKRFFK